MRRGVRLALGTALVLALWPAGATAGSRLTSGLHGRVTLYFSPCTPRSCNPPAKRFTLVFRQKGIVVARTRTDGSGRYRIRLKPGRYGVSPLHTQRIGKGLTPNRVTVGRGTWKRLDFVYDTGRR